MTIATKAKLILVFLPALLAGALFSLPDSAWAGESFAITKFESAITNENGGVETHAAAHPYAMTTTVEFASHEEGEEEEYHVVPSGSVKDLEVGLPAGVIVNPDATKTRCAEAILDANSSVRCPITSVVGVVHTTLGLVPHGTTGAYPVYNMVPPPGVPAEFGFYITAAGVVVHIYGDARTGDDYGLSAETTNTLGRGLVDGVGLTLWGDPTAESHDTERGACAEEKGRSSCSAPRLERPLLTLPSACTGMPLKATVKADSWQEPENFLEKEATLPAITGCKELSFNPTLSVQPTKLTAESPTGLEVNLKIPQQENLETLAEADLKGAVVKLPVGMAISPSAASGLAGCPLLRGREKAQEEREERREEVGIDLESKQLANCPDASKLGTVEIVTPLLEDPLQGAVYLAQQGNLPGGSGSNPFGSLFALYVVAEGSGVVVKLPGEVTLDQATGQVSARFGKDPTTGFYLPQLPFSELKMGFFGGPRAPLVTPSSCGTYTTSSVLTPYGSEADPLLEPVSVSSEPSSNFTIGSGCSARGFAPAFTAGTTSVDAGGFSDETVTIARNEGEQNLGGIAVTTPPGLLGKISEVELCQEPQAREGACGAGSLIGETAAAVGPGEYPFWLKGGRVYISGPYDGAPYGLSIVEPTTAGPFTLEGNGGFGKEVIRASIAINPKTDALTITSAVPPIVDGVPLDIRTINVTINRPGFIFDPTNCEAFRVTSSITSTEGATASPSSRFQAANCAALKFAPQFSASTQGNGKKGGHGASLDVKIGYPQPQSAYANIAKVDTQLPPALSSRLTTLHKACTEAQFAANPAGCPPGSVVGTVTASTPVLNSPLTGPAYLVSHGGAAFPDLVLLLQGEGVEIELVGHTDIEDGITYSKFETVPDAPVSSFELNLPEKEDSLLGAIENLCAPTKTVAVSKRITVKRHGRRVKVTRKVSQTEPEPLVMPTTLTGQNGAVLSENVTVAVTGCPKAAGAKKVTEHKKKGRGEKK